MELSGTLSENLRAGITSARRLRGHRVHSDTLAFWRELLAFARARLRKTEVSESELEGLVAELATELESRSTEAEG